MVRVARPATHGCAQGVRTRGPINKIEFYDEKSFKANDFEKLNLHQKYFYFICIIYVWMLLIDLIAQFFEI